MYILDTNFIVIYEIFITPVWERTTKWQYYQAYYTI